LDPFLWAITLEMPASSRPISLVLDASNGSSPVYEQSLLWGIWEHLSNHGELSAYYLGQVSPASHPGQQPPTGPPRFVRKRLIGPILEKASPDTRVIVVSTGPIIDLADFYRSPWRDRLLLVTIGEDYQQDWPNVIAYRADDSPAVLVDALLRL